MSGSGDSSVGYVSGGTGGRDEPCQALRLDRALEAPVPVVVAALTPGDVLAVDLIEGPPTVVVLTDSAGQTAGSVIPTAQLIECLRQGVQFEAEVVSASGGAVRVEVRASS